jgi:uncharacterized membrane protein
LLFKSGRRLLYRPQPMRPSVRGLNIGAALGLLVGVYAVIVGFQATTGVSFPTGFAFYPDLTATAVVAMGLALLLAAVRIALVIRDSRLELSRSSLNKISKR